MSVTTVAAPAMPVAWRWHNSEDRAWKDGLPPVGVHESRIEVAYAAGAMPWRSMATAPLDGTEVLIRVKLRAGMQGRCVVGHFIQGGYCIEDHPAVDRGWYFWNGCMFDKAAEPESWLPLPDAAPQGEAMPWIAEAAQRLLDTAPEITDDSPRSVIDLSLVALYALNYAGAQAKPAPEGYDAGYRAAMAVTHQEAIEGAQTYGGTIHDGKLTVYCNGDEVWSCAIAALIDQLLLRRVVHSPAAETRANEGSETDLADVAGSARDESAQAQPAKPDADLARDIEFVKWYYENTRSQAKIGFGRLLRRLATQQTKPA